MGDTSESNLRRLFDLAMDAPPDRRDAAIVEACGGDVELLERVRAIVRAAGDSKFLAAPEFAARPEPVVTAPPLEQPGTVIGPYSLVRLIGEGGFGTVYLAEQTAPVRREVALKIVKPGMDTRQVLARFEQERQALALMEHPNIARVFDGGVTDSGRPYFVMELVRGESIIAYCDGAQLGISARLELFAQVCEAVQHAHAKGVIHRDLKPSNVLVATIDGKPVVKVIDFGIAKATLGRLTNHSLLTDARQLIGTPQYMSPEQAIGSDDVDTRSDVYSLGVLLYELLTGSTPIDERTLRSAAYAEIQRLLVEQEPAKPSTRVIENDAKSTTIAHARKTDPTRLRSIIRGELDWVVMRSIEKDRARRYQTAAEFAADVRRYLAGEAVLAAPPSRSYQLRKIFRRHRAAVGATLAVGVALIAGAAAFAWQAREASRERDLAIQAREQAIAAQRAEREARDEAMRKQQLAESVSAFFSDELLARGNPERLDGDRPVTLREALDASARALGGRFKDEPLIRAAIEMTLGRAYRGLGQWDDAIKHYRLALDLRRAALPPDAEDVTLAKYGLGLAYSKAGNTPEAQRLLHEVLADAQQRHGQQSTHAATISIDLAFTHLNVREFRPALDMFEPSYAVLSKELGDDNYTTLLAMNGIATAYIALREPEKALPISERRLAGLRRTLGDDHPETALAMVTLGRIYLDQKQFDRSLDLYRRADAIQKASLGEDHPRRILTLTQYAFAVARSGDVAGSLPLYEDALRLCRQSSRIDKGTLADTLARYAGALISATRYDEAEKALLEAYPIVRDAYGPLDSRTRSTAGTLVKLYERWGKPEAADAYRAAASQPATKPTSFPATTPT
jgi:serine/threonine protein kinase/uncharacterized protein HemY